MKYICIVCPRSCDLELTDENGELAVTGAACGRGAAYAKNEYTNPKRMITTTVVLKGAAIKRLPVISDGEVPKAALRRCLEFLYGFAASAPVKMGDVIVENLLGTGANILAARTISAEG